MDILPTDNGNYVLCPEEDERHALGRACVEAVVFLYQQEGLDPQYPEIVMAPLARIAIESLCAAPSLDGQGRHSASIMGASPNPRGRNSSEQVRKITVDKTTLININEALRRYANGGIGLVNIHLLLGDSESLDDSPLADRVRESETAQILQRQVEAVIPRKTKE